MFERALIVRLRYERSPALFGAQVEALARVTSPFVTALMGSFQDSRALYLCVEYMRGPDLFAYKHEINADDGEHHVPIHAVQARERTFPA